MKQSLLTLTSSKQGGGLNADTLFVTGPYSDSYSSWTLDAATTYYRNTGDTAFARQILPWLEGQLSYDATLTDSDGLIVTGSQISTTDGGYDWDFYDGAKTGVVTEFNELYYQDLRDVAYIEAHLGNTAKAAAFDQTADHVRDEINANLFNPATSTYYLSESDHTTLAQDANALAVVLGIARWACGPTPIMTGYVLGVQPMSPGYQTFTVTPHPGSLQWAEGTVPTPYGRISSSGRGMVAGSR